MRAIKMLREVCQHYYYHLLIIVQLGSSFQINTPEPTHRIFTNLTKSDWGSYTREAKESFALLQLPSSCSTGESQFRKLLNTSAKHHISQGHIASMIRRQGSQKCNPTRIIWSIIKNSSWKTCQNPGICQLRICRPPPLPSVLIPSLWQMRNVLNRMEKQFSDFYFSNYREVFIENWNTKMIITRKIKIGKI